MKVIREFVLLCFIAIASGERNLQLFQELMESYNPQSELSNIPWETFIGFEKDLRSMPPSTTRKLHTYFEKMNRGRVQYEDAMNSIVSVCTVSKTALPHYMRTMDIKKLNKLFNRFKNAFEDSNSKLSILQDYLRDATESISSFEPLLEISTKHRFVITDLSNGMATFEIEGSVLERSDALNSLNDLLKDMCRTGLSTPNKITFELSKKGPKNAFSERINSIKNELPLIINNLNSLIAFTREKLKTFVDSIEPAEPSDVDNMLTKCREFNTHHGV